MTLPRLEALSRAWRKCPPTHRLLAAWLGYKAPAENQRGDLAELAGLMGLGTPDLR